ncbi:hypothetical protein OSB04_026807 [Centaurea solstitialis]|uniref:F-box domain-containing protein n=1 Tax=Centaurea solstitialis TaxID=347529 RepID=A0AA38SQU1_9ASTR|nr:hypothetical protein OSB04_026807 [Centaurea solstitialis]
MQEQFRPNMSRAEQKRARMIEDGRLDNLPESLQLHILSFLDKKEAVQMSLLSKQWFSLWTSMPVLHLNSFDIPRVVDFDKFVNRVLSHRDQSAKLNTLTFTHGGSSSSPKILKEVVDYAFSHGVNHLELSIQCFDSRPLCLHTTSFNLLKTLKLKSQSYFSCTFLLGSFKNLTVLHLKGAIIPNNNCEPFLLGFPMLEKLVLKDCCLGKILCVEALKLSDLTISFHGYFDRCKLTTPNLRFFKYIGSEFPRLETHDGLPLLDTVVVDFQGLCELSEEKRMIDDLISLFRGVGNARSVTLSSRIAHLLCLFEGNLEELDSPFCDLKCLKMDVRYMEQDEKLFDTHSGRRTQLIEMKTAVKAYLLKRSPEAKFSIIHSTN